MCNVYVGAALRKPGTFPGARASHEDVLALTASYCDLDEPGAAATAKDKYGRAKPTLVVVTGRDPHLRAQMWWRLTEPITDKAAWQALLKGMAHALGGDTQRHRSAARHAACRDDSVAGQTRPQGRDDARSCR